jgi:hypothetical protein
MVWQQLCLGKGGVTGAAGLSESGAVPAVPAHSRHRTQVGLQQLCLCLTD